MCIKLQVHFHHAMPRPQLAGRPTYAGRFAAGHLPRPNMLSHVEPHGLTALAPLHMLRRAEPSEAYPPCLLRRSSPFGCEGRARRLRRVSHLAVIHGFTPVAFCEGGSKHPGSFGTFSSYRPTIGDSPMVRVGVSSIEKSGWLPDAQTDSSALYWVQREFLSLSFTARLATRRTPITKGEKQ
jgi:hypothetical protein